MIIRAGTISAETRDNENAKNFHPIIRMPIMANTMKRMLII
tara:strand:- start:492 stop:614 length:123 start_codon:yes stop_codon:yes gene_type:complete